MLSESKEFKEFLKRFSYESYNDQSLDYKIMLNAILNDDKNIRFLLVSDMYGNVVNSKHRKGEENFLTEDETKASLVSSAESWRVRKEHAVKIGQGKYALVEYEKICRITMPLGDDRLLLVTTDKNENPSNSVKQILNKIAHPIN